MRSQTWCSIVQAAMVQGSLVEQGDCASTWSCKRKVETGPRTVSLFTSKLNRKFVATTGQTIAYCLVWIAGRKVFPDPDIAKGLKSGVIKSG